MGGGGAPFEAHAFGPRNVPFRLLSNSRRLLQNLLTALAPEHLTELFIVPIATDKTTYNL